MTNAAENAAKFSGACLAPYLAFSEGPQKLMHRWPQTGHKVWLYPLNCLSNLAGAVSTLLVSIVNMIAAGIFKLMHLITKNPQWQRASKANAVATTIAMRRCLPEMVVRMFNPHCKSAVQQILTQVKGSLT